MTRFNFTRHEAYWRCSDFPSLSSMGYFFRFATRKRCGPTLTCCTLSFSRCNICNPCLVMNLEGIFACALQRVAPWIFEGATFKLLSVMKLVRILRLEAKRKRIAELGRFGPAVSELALPTAQTPV